MNANQLINMAVRMVMRKLMHKGINAGIGMATRRGPGADAEDQPDPHAKARTKETQKRMRQSARITRRFGRF